MKVASAYQFGSLFIAIGFCLSPGLQAQESNWFEQEMTIVRFHLGSDGALIPIVSSQKVTQIARKWLSSEEMIAELELDDDQMRDYQKVVNSWEREFEKTLNDDRLADTVKSNTYMQDAIRNIKKIDEILLPHQQLAVKQIVRRFDLRSQGFANVVNSPKFRAEHGITINEFKTVLESRISLLRFVESEGKKIQEAAIERLVSGFVDPRKTQIKDLFQTRFGNTVQLEVLIWQLGLISDSDEKLAAQNFLAVDPNKFESILVTPLFTTRLDGSFEIVVVDSTESTTSLLSHLMSVLLDEEQQDAFDLTETEIQLLRKIQAEQQQLADQWRSDNSAMSESEWKQQFDLKRSSWLKNIRTSIIDDQRQQKLDEYARSVLTQKFGIPIALMNDSLTKEILLNETEKSHLEKNAGHARTEMESATRELQAKLFERSLELLSPKNQKFLKDYYGPELKYAKPNITLEIFNLSNLR